MTTALVHFDHTIRDGRITWPDMRHAQWKPNYGDMLVCAALLRQVELGPTVRVGFGNTLPARSRGRLSAARPTCTTGWISRP